MRSRDYYNRRNSQWPRWGLIAVLAVVMVYAAWQLISYALQMNESRNLRNELAAAVQEEETLAQPETTLQPETQVTASSSADGTVQQHSGETAVTVAPEVTTAPVQATATLRPAVSASAAPTKVPDRPPEILMTYQGLWERNNDLVGWLNVKALPQVDIPVVQRDQTYYLRRDFNGRSNMNGTAFLDVACSIWPRSDNLIIYAHNMKSGEMFGGMQKLMKEIFYRESPLTSFNTLYERANYVPVAVVLCSIYREDADFFNFYVANFRNQEAFDSYIARARELSSVNTPYDVRYGDDLLTLVTCYDEAHRQRLMVILRRVRPDEDPQVLAKMWE